MNELRINPGHLRTPIDIYGKAATGTGGFKTGAYTKLFSCGSQWVNAHGQDSIIADSNQVQKIATVTVRYDSRITEMCRVYLGTAVYEIVTGIDNIRNRNEWMQFKVRAVVSG